MKNEIGHRGIDRGLSKLEVNGTNVFPNTKILEVEKLTLYPNGYININQNGEYTKHYYADEVRIASKIGGGYNIPISYNADNSQGEYALEMMKNELGVLTGDNVDNITHSLDTISYLTGNGNTEDGLYFYHGNHLSSTQLITDINANISQAVLYTPWGSVIKEYKADWMLDTIPRYLFNAKEKDEESGLYYYEARYYSDKNIMFTARDPKFEEKPWLNPYHYCSNNPVNRIDPTGKIDFPLRGHYAVNKKDYKNGAWGLANAIVRTSLYQERRNIGTSPHIGIDYRASVGTPVYSLGDGVVNDIGTMKNGIKYITIEYENGDKLRFLHMDKIADDMKIGGKVYEGQIIGDAGNSGQYKGKDGTMKSYAPHLHVDAKDKDGNPISPEQNKYGTIDNKTFFDQFEGDYMKLYQYKQESIRKLDEAGGVLE